MVLFTTLQYPTLPRLGVLSVLENNVQIRYSALKFWFFDIDAPINILQCVEMCVFSSGGLGMAKSVVVFFFLIFFTQPRQG